MKPQDIFFIIILLVLLFLRKPRVLVVAGILSLALSVPLFVAQVFFTAQRLTYYALGFFLIATILYLLDKRHNQ